jgi:hypothetical protein
MTNLITCEDEGLKKDIFGSMVAQIVAHALRNGSGVLLLQLRYTGTISALRCSPVSALEAVGL